MVQWIIWFNGSRRPHHFFKILITYNMGYQRSSDYIQREAIIQEAIKRLDSKEFPSIRSAAAHFEVPFTTLHNRVAGMQSRTESYETRQILSNAEEKTIVRWVTRQAAIRFPVTPGLLKETA